MGAYPPTEALTKSKREGGRKPPAPLNLASVYALLEDHLGKTPRRDRLERDDRAYRWAIRKAEREGNPFRTTWAQAAYGMGYEVTGDPKVDHSNAGRQAMRALSSLRELGLVRFQPATKENGYIECLEVQLLEHPGQRSILAGSETDPAHDMAAYVPSPRMDANVCSVRRSFDHLCVRPVGCTNGRRPSAGYPEIEPADAGFLAGFIEGEATFAIVRQVAPKSGSRSYGCRFALSARDDDAVLIQALQRTTGLGSVSWSPSRDGIRPQVRWVIHAKSDCQRLVEILDKWPLRGRKSHDYAIWRDAVEWWIDGDPTSRPANRDWTPMAYLKERLHEVKRYREPERVFINPPDLLMVDWPDYFAGFITAESSLGICRVGSSRVVPRLTLRLRADDRPLLRALRAWSDAGRIYRAKPSGCQNPVIQWMVFAARDLQRICERLDHSPPRGRKATEYAIWRRAVELFVSGRSARERDAEMHQLRDALARARRYESGDVGAMSFRKGTSTVV